MARPKKRKRSKAARKKSFPQRKRAAKRSVKRAAKALSFQTALKIIASATGFHYNTLRQIFKGRSADAIRIASLKDVKAGFRRFQKMLELGRLEKAGVKGTKKQVKEFLELRELTKKNRVERKFYKSESRIPKRYRPFAKKIKKGQNRGKWSVFYDTVFKTPIEYSTAKRLKHENRIVRMSLAIEGADFKDQGRFKKYYTTKEKEKVKKSKGIVDFKIAEKVSRRIADDFYDQEVFDDFIEEFGYVA